MERLSFDELKHYYSNMEAKEINLRIVTDLLEQVDRYLTNIKIYDLDTPLDTLEPTCQQSHSPESNC